MKHTNIGVCGASGFIGKNLCAALLASGYRVIPLSRELLSSGNKLSQTLASCDAVINVAGVPINHRWSEAYKALLYDSRVGVVKQLTAAMPPSVRTFISASAVGYYPSQGCYDESNNVSGTDFLAGLCRAWEAEVHKAPQAVRKVITRFGVVLAADGGAFEKLATGAGVASVVLGSGDQSFSWIAIDDLCRAMIFLLESELSGTVNLVAPQQLTQSQVAREIGRHYGAKLTFSVPAFVLRAAMGESADFVLKGQCVRPSRLLAAGFHFQCPSLSDFLCRLPD